MGLNLFFKRTFRALQFGYETSLHIYAVYRIYMVLVDLCSSSYKTHS